MVTALFSQCLLGDVCTSLIKFGTYTIGYVRIRRKMTYVRQL